MKALIADDDRVATTLLATVLKRWGFEVSIANDGVAAWEQLVGQAPALAIVDWMMPGLDGPDLCRRIRGDSRLGGMHVILLTGRSGQADIVAGLDAGADDYVVKPFQIEELRARVQVGVRVIQLKERLAAEVERLQAARDDLEHLANSDVLTDLCNRRSWFNRAAIEHERCRRYARPIALLMVDLDHFKKVNDTYGHVIGDLVLKRFAELLRDVCRTSDVVGRVGGEEFAVLLPETCVDNARHVAHRIVHACRDARLAAPHDDIRFTCSIGVAGVDGSDMTIDDTMRRADVALYEAKRSGRYRATTVADLAAAVTAPGSTAPAAAPALPA
jgi:two-component system cell cycle response regulator